MLSGLSASYLNEGMGMSEGGAQEGYLQLSTNSEQLFANKRGHEIRIEQPDAAVAAIVKMVEQVRAR
jgi:hypothetical protein